ncbi:hypothetical protein [Corynebacterium sp. UBA2622]|uniref:hypothetical protein n=1 Tax=Corynebacterium sp. UBA2622 TaxID=1946393 RepID=UPI0025C57D5F|nr:hypothetical protein [Corynebacterium sp. UBA2622]
MSGHHILIMPGAPALVAELAPAHEPSRRLAAAARRAAAGTGIARAEIVCSLDERWRTGVTGSFAAWGAPRVSTGAGNHLPELVARHVLGGGPSAAGSRPHIGRLNSEALTVVVVDGPAGLNARAPLSLVVGAADTHAALQRFLAGAGEVDVDTLGAVGVVEPYLWGELAALEPVSARLVDSDDSLGVGAYVAVWEV